MKKGIMLRTQVIYDIVSAYAYNIRTCTCYEDYVWLKNRAKSYLNNAFYVYHLSNSMEIFFMRKIQNACAESGYCYRSPLEEFSFQHRLGD